MAQLRAIVSGRVQGVCYRAETVMVGRKLGLTGFARNLADGTVEVIAQGEKQGLIDLLEWLKLGPAVASVDNVTVDWVDETLLSSGFNIHY